MKGRYGFVSKEIEVITCSPMKLPGQLFKSGTDDGRKAVIARINSNTYGKRNHILFFKKSNRHVYFIHFNKITKNKKVIFILPYIKKC